ncbi:DegT/DnrJ/EryC1/StrS family aminotransferase [Francisellaceae bacterium]|nr:DegT/DnrJ/EryC1/StrS family aminotransferase [Francisellaceae bacterium]
MSDPHIHGSRYFDDNITIVKGAKIQRFCHMLANSQISWVDQRVRVGVNSRLDTIQGAMLQVKLKYLYQEIETRRQTAKACQNNIKTQILFTKTDRTHVYGQYTARVKDRVQFIAELKEQGIPTTIHYPVPLNKQSASLDVAADCMISDTISEQVVSLPILTYSEFI